MTSRRDVGLGVLAPIPDNVLLKIFSNLSKDDLVTCFLVSGAFYVFSHEPDNWLDIFLASKHSRSSCPSLRLVNGSWMASCFDFKDSASFPQQIVINGFHSDYLYCKWFRAHVDLSGFTIPARCVPTLPRISVGKFYDEYERASQPVKLRDCITNWSLESWSVDALTVNYPTTRFSIQHSGKQKVEWTLAQYFAYAQSQRDEAPLYLFDSHFCEKAPEMLAAYHIPPYFTDDYFGYLGSARPPFRWLVIGPARSGASWHIDPNLTSAWNALLVGRKRWALYPPHRTPPGVQVSRNRKGEVVWRSDNSVTWYLDIYPHLAEEEKPLEVVQEAGEVMFVPSGWWHMVINLELTVAVTHNYVGSANLAAVCSSLRAEDSSGSDSDSSSEEATSSSEDDDGQHQRAHHLRASLASGAGASEDDDGQHQHPQRASLASGVGASEDDDGQHQRAHRLRASRTSGAGVGVQPPLEQCVTPGTIPERKARALDSVEAPAPVTAGCVTYECARSSKGKKEKRPCRSAASHPEEYTRFKQALARFCGPVWQRVTDSEVYVREGYRSERAFRRSFRDLDKWTPSINKVLARSGLPSLTVDSLQAASTGTNPVFLTETHCIKFYSPTPPPCMGATAKDLVDTTTSTSATTTTATTPATTTSATTPATTATATTPATTTSATTPATTSATTITATTSATTATATTPATTTSATTPATTPSTSHTAARATITMPTTATHNATSTSHNDGSPNTDDRTNVPTTATHNTASTSHNATTYHRTNAGSTPWLDECAHQDGGRCRSRDTRAAFDACVHELDVYRVLRGRGVLLREKVPVVVGQGHLYDGANEADHDHGQVLDGASKASKANENSDQLHDDENKTNPANGLLHYAVNEANTVKDQPASEAITSNGRLDDRSNEANPSNGRFCERANKANTANGRLHDRANEANPPNGRVHDTANIANTLNGPMRSTVHVDLTNKANEQEGPQRWPWPYLVLTRLSGQPLRKLDVGDTDMLVLADTLARFLSELHSTPMQPAGRGWCDFVSFAVGQRERVTGRHLCWQTLPLHLVEGLVDYLPSCMSEWMASLAATPCLLHGDVTSDNVLMNTSLDQSRKRGRNKKPRASYQLSGVIDFGDSIVGPSIYECVAVFISVFQCNKKYMRRFLAHYTPRLSHASRSRFAYVAMCFTLLHDSDALRTVFQHRPEYAACSTLAALEHELWSAIVA